ncbi:MAG TPA: DEAD/DEAH box helicase [Solirubrobacteraceae bacterium]|jgi:ATP-dependent RNA helicase DeaD|nr:DEAD/DEAH box helicase [Solirubrobacteraceae bacterium]
MSTVMAKTFAELGLSESTQQALRDVGYESPSPIQEQAIPELLQGHDVIGQAQTGTGKTAAFGLPIMEYIDASEQSVQALVLTPTRELCIQVTQALRTYGAHSGVDVVAVFGGAPIRTQQAQLRAGGHVVVGTVGRVLDLISRHSLVLHDCRFVVLDEADEMLDLGFLEDVEKILSLTPSSRQTALFSATMPPPIRKLADHYMYDPTIVQVEAATLTIDTVAQFQLPVEVKEKPDKLVEVLKAEMSPQALADGAQAIVFVRTKIRCEQLFRTLRDRGMNVRALHGDMSQGSRDGVMLAFKGGRVPILVATDVAARGLDISTVTVVVNYDVPTSPDTYVHRIGRTGRVGRSGRAITFVERRQSGELEAIERHIGTNVARWEQGVVAAPTPVRERPRRHSKPRISPRHDHETYAKLVLGGGSAEGLSVADIVASVTSSAGLDGEAVRDVLVLERFSFLSVPEAEAERVIAALNGREIGSKSPQAVSLGRVKRK